jgi:hypothetical protein
MHDEPGTVRAGLFQIQPTKKPARGQVRQTSFPELYWLAIVSLEVAICGNRGWQKATPVERNSSKIDVCRT